jgi:predicted transcriptional regulator of viral defense system
VATEIAAAQWGVIGLHQLLACGVSRAMVGRWLAEGRLHPIHRGVYALGHPAISIEGRLVAALLLAGPGGVLSHATAAWWWGLAAASPTVIDLTTEARARSVSDVKIHRRRRFESTRHRRLPVTTVAQTILDLAAAAPLAHVRRVLAEADYRRLLDLDAILAVAGQGRPGSATLRTALARHQPRLALTRSQLEERFLCLCEDAGLPTPEVNAGVSRMSIDFLWREQKLAVEVDGYDGHRSNAQLERDRRRELWLRANGYTVIRYTADQVANEAALVVADLRRLLLSRPGPSVARESR